VPRLPVLHGHREPHDAGERPGPAPVPVRTGYAGTGYADTRPAHTELVASTVPAGLGGRLALVAWILVAACRAMMRRPDSLGEG
jgi:hypothetical protein